MPGPRESLTAEIHRHGEVAELGELIERGEKPPYEDFVAFMEGRTDPPIDEESTRKIIEDKFARGELAKQDFDIIVCTDALRGRQTGETLARVTGKNVPIHPTRYLREVKMPMGGVTPDFYEQAPGIKEVREKFLGAFLSGEKVDEEIVDVYKRAQRFLTYFRRIRKFTSKKPLFVSHGIFSRFLDLAITHEGETLSDSEIRDLVQKDFAATKRPGLLGGFELVSSKEGIKIVGVL